MPSPSITALGGIKIGNTSSMLNEHTKLCMLLYSPPKYGKTRCAGSLDKMTKKFAGKPSLFIACEAAEGGGAMSIQHLGVDYVTPTSWNEFVSLLTALQADKTYGGIVLDNVTDVVKRFVMPHALAMPFEKGTAPATRALGVPAQNDYQTAGEMLRSKLNQLMNLTKHPDLSIRKHLVVCALQKDKTDRKTGELIRIQPDLPGAMAEDASGMFQTLASLEIRTRVGPDPNDPKKTVRISDRVLITGGEEKKTLGDRMEAFPKEGPTDLCEVWEKYFIPRIEGSKAA